jgi:hypothetical protein
MRGLGRRVRRKLGLGAVELVRQLREEREVNLRLFKR